MGLFGFLGDVASVTIKIATIPVAVAVDVVNVATDQKPDTTENHIESIGTDLEGAVEELMP